MNVKYTSYHEKILPNTPTILGLKLLPFTMGHSLALQSENSCFFDSSKMPNNELELINELFIALIICSLTYEQYSNAKYDGTLKEMAKEYFKELNRCLGVNKNKWLRLFSMQPKNPVNINACKAAFTNYLAQAMIVAPTMETEDSKNKMANNPVEIEESIKDTLMGECGYTYEQILNLPYSEILAAYQLYAHKQGVISLQSKRELEIIERAKKKKA